MMSVNWRTGLKKKAILKSHLRKIMNKKTAYNEDLYLYFNVKRFSEGDLGSKLVQA